MNSLHCILDPRKPPQRLYQCLRLSIRRSHGNGCVGPPVGMTWLFGANGRKLLRRSRLGPGTCSACLGQATLCSIFLSLKNTMRSPVERRLSHAGTSDDVAQRRTDLEARWRTELEEAAATLQWRQRAWSSDHDSSESTTADSSYASHSPVSEGGSSPSRTPSPLNVHDPGSIAADASSASDSHVYWRESSQSGASSPRSALVPSPRPASASSVSLSLVYGRGSSPSRNSSRLNVLGSFAADVLSALDADVSEESYQWPSGAASRPSMLVYQSFFTLVQTVSRDTGSFVSAALNTQYDSMVTETFLAAIVKSPASRQTLLRVCGQFHLERRLMCTLVGGMCWHS
ncbi:hypothetical protein C8F04DRAFT_485030 [Mycena alexandri]|uniref:Uncharacterized protein n=1 Tax=Mycena alexandri TaxID=1745969 RepID=A0AAD6S1A4_9AGAR|nr:hypothetical protein C8F04DRAFT_485030 [Mycena alexandri]